MTPGPAIQTLPLGEGGPDVSALCLGTMLFGSAVPEDASRAVLDAYAEAGGSFLDTANVYASWVPGAQGGESEALLGRWFRDRKNRDRMFVATKAGSRLQKSGFGLKAAQIVREFEASLDRMGIEHVDLMYAHFDDRGTPIEETLSAFDRLVRDGKARFLGASNHRAWRLELMRETCVRNGWARYCCVQQRYSFHQPAVRARFGVQVAANDDLLEYAAFRGLRILAYSPLLGGLYDGRPDRRLSLAYAGERNDLRLAVLKAVAAERGITPNQAVLAWMLHHDPAVIPIVAASRVEQMRQNLAALDVRLSPDDMARLDAEPKGK